MHLRADVWGLHWRSDSVQRYRDGDWQTRTTWHHQDSKVSLASAEKEHKTSGWTPYVHGFTSENGGGREEKSRAWRLEIPRPDEEPSARDGVILSPQHPEKTATKISFNFFKTCISIPGLSSSSTRSQLHCPLKPFPSPLLSGLNPPNRPRGRRDPP